MEPGRPRKLVTAALALAMFLAALEATAVGTAMPTVVSELGGVSRYSWVFSAYLLASTTTVPMYGKLADLYGRLRIFTIAVVLFLVGAALCGVAQTFTQLILFRAIQGVGAGGVIPVAITVVGDIYSLEERGRIQGIFSGVWAISSLVGPAAGGLITDLLSWRWVFYLNLPFGIASIVMLHWFLREEERLREHRLDLAGTLSLTASIALLLLALLEGTERWGLGDARTLSMIGFAGDGLILFLWLEKRAPEPMLPLELFQNRVIAVASAGGFLMGTVLFCAAAFVPMFTQGVLGGTAIDAGMTLAPMSIGWPIASTTSGWFLAKHGYRPFILSGAILATLGCLLLAATDPSSGRGSVMLAMFFLGLGLGFLSTPYLLAVQNAVPRHQRGVATSSVQFFRTIGGSIAVAALGTVLNAHLSGSLVSGIDPNVALNPELRAGIPPQVLGELVSALDGGLGAIYLAMALLALVGLGVGLLFPKGSAQAHAYVDS
ncbi:MAG: DHA2 family efflux MFS transporter permease subunit [Gemmatimonadales bacterium]|nr:MAG: DHA2 family efflux MFS transporter permease subunit [Gemmatimonadales bacterium]